MSDLPHSMMDYDMYSKDRWSQLTIIHALVMDSGRLTANQMHHKFCQCRVGIIWEKSHLKSLVSPLLGNICNQTTFYWINSDIWTKSSRFWIFHQISFYGEKNIDNHVFSQTYVAHCWMMNCTLDSSDLK